MFGKLQEAKQKMEEVKQRLDTIFVNGEAEGGKVKATVSVSKKLKRIDISEQLWQENDREQVEDLIVVAVNRAMEQADNVSQAEMHAIAKDMLPGGLGALGNLFGR